MAGLDLRTLQRWKAQGGGDDQRRGPKTRPHNKLSEAERQNVIEIATSPEYRDLSPRQIVPQLADNGEYVASEATFYRILLSEEMMAHRAATRPATHHRPDELVATAPNQVWSWDITYLPTNIIGKFFYLYLFEDLFSRSIVAWEVYERESDEHSAELMEATCIELKIDPGTLTLHSDNGGPMKGATMLAMLRHLHVAASRSRPGVSDDSPYIEALFRTLKYCPKLPRKPFATIEEARAWVAAFVNWYNTQHRHSHIRYVTPCERYEGRDRAILARRHKVYVEAQRRHPERWSRNTRDWQPIEAVVLNPSKQNTIQQ